MHDPHLFPLYIIGTLLVTGFAVAFVVFIVIQKQRQVRSQLERQRLQFEYSRSLLDTKIEVQEATLKMLSEELHDNINQMLGSSFMQVSSASTLVGGGEAGMVLNDAKTTLRGAINNLRLLSHSLNTALVEDREIEEAIQSELDRIAAFSNIQCTLESDALHEPSPEQRLLVFRIVQEGLQNILNHAQASTITVLVNSSKQWFDLQLIDNGIGFELTPKHQVSSLGMRNIHERAVLLGGTVSIVSAPGQGTTLTLHIPLN